MKYQVLSVILLAFAVAMAAAARQQDQKAQENSAFDRLKTLAGDWTATTVEGGKEMSAPVIFRLASGGSVLMSDLAPGMPHEMITMFHRDGGDLLATHYCLTGNQPRMRAVTGADPNEIAFELKDITNLPSPAAPHMVGVKFTLLDAHHHIEDWTIIGNGQTTIRKFDCRRRS
jgi:hypothetical protein